MSNFIKSYDKYKSGLRVDLYSDKLIIVKPGGDELRPYTDIKKGFKIAKWLNNKLFNESKFKVITQEPKSLNPIKPEPIILSQDEKDKIEYNKAMHESYNLEALHKLIDEDLDLRISHEDIYKSAVSKGFLNHPSIDETIIRNIIKTNASYIKDEDKDKPSFKFTLKPFRDKDSRVLSASDDLGVYAFIDGVKKDLTAEIMNSPNKRKTSDKNTCGLWNLKKGSRIQPSVILKPITLNPYDDDDLKDNMKVYNSNINKAVKKGFKVSMDDDDKSILVKELKDMKTTFIYAKPKISVGA